MPEADLILEGGGVRGIGLVGALTVLLEQGYTFPRVGGTSAGAIVASLAAAGVPAERLREELAQLDYRRFADTSLLDKLPLLGPLLSVTFQNGYYEGREINRWIAGLLEEQGVRTFRDLRLPPDPGSDLAPEQQYKLVVVVADVTQGRLVRLPWDYERLYGLDPDEQSVADAVQASSAIPYVYEPVRLAGSLLVDGGLLSNFPIAMFDRRDGQPPRWPTFGVRIYDRALAAEPVLRGPGPVAYAFALGITAVVAHDRLTYDDPCVQARTMEVDTAGVGAIDFGIDEATQRLLYDNGRAAAEGFLATWDWPAYLDRCRR
jgi:NTE family protein